MKARGHASREVESSRKFIKKHPMKNVEEFIEFTMERRLDEDKPDSKAKSEPKPKSKLKPDESTPKSKPEPIPEPGAARRSGRDRQPVQRFGETISEHDTKNL